MPLDKPEIRALQTAVNDQINLLSKAVADTEHLIDMESDLSNDSATNRALAGAKVRAKAAAQAIVDLL